MQEPLDEGAATRALAPAARAPEAWIAPHLPGAQGHPRVGGKAANLGELHRAGLPVPQGFAITADASQSAMEAAGVRSELLRRFQALRAEGPELASTGAELRAQADLLRQRRALHDRLVADLRLRLSVARAASPTQVPLQDVSEIGARRARPAQQAGGPERRGQHRPGRGALNPHRGGLPGLRAVPSY